jgi:hypothetical protein
MTQKPMLRVEVGKGRLCGLLSLGDSTSIYCFSTLRPKTEEITPDQKAFLFLAKNNRHERYLRPINDNEELRTPTSFSKEKSTQLLKMSSVPELLLNSGT